KVLTQVEQLHDVAWLERRRIRWLTQQQRLDESAVPEHVANVPVVRFAIPLGVSGDLAPQGVVIVVESKMTAVAHHRASTVIGNYLQPIPGQVEFTNNLCPQQTANVRAIRVSEVLVQL